MPQYCFHTLRCTDVHKDLTTLKILLCLRKALKGQCLEWVVRLSTHYCLANHGGVEAYSLALPKPTLPHKQIKRASEAAADTLGRL